MTGNEMIRLTPKGAAVAKALKDIQAPLPDIVSTAGLLDAHRIQLDGISAMINDAGDLSARWRERFARRLLEISERLVVGDK